MKILTFLHSFEPGGVERVALRLVRRWRESGIDAPLYMGREDGALRTELAKGLDYQTPRPGFAAGWFETLWMIWKLPGVIAATKPDLLFCAGNTYTVVAVLMKMILGRRCPPIVAKVSNDLVLPGLPLVWRGLYRAWAWLQLRLIDGWVVMHPAMRAELIAVGGRREIAVIPDPALTTAQIAALRAWRPRAPTAGGRRFVAMGRLAAQKNYPLMLRAFAAGAGPMDELTIFGGGPDRVALERMTDAFGLSGRVRFEGHVAWSATCLIGQDALLLSSHYEGIPAVLVEAMSCGMPILATDCGPGVRGLLAGYATGRLVANGDVAAFAAGISRWSEALPTGVPTGFAAERYTVEAGAMAYVEAFARVVEGPEEEALPALARVPIQRR